MDDVLCDFSQAHKNARLKNPELDYPQSIAGFFTNLKPLPNCIKLVNKLRSVDVFEVYILTAPSIMNPLCYTEKRLWIGEKFDMDMVGNLIISPNKGLNKGDYLIDDNINGKGQENFEGEVLHFGSDKFKNWDVIWAYFKTKYTL